MNLFVIRHGETAWSLSGQHTGTTDIPLTDNGRRLAQRLRPVLATRGFRAGPRQPAAAGDGRPARSPASGGQAIVEPDLIEWNYGQIRRADGQANSRSWPGWLIFRDGCPGGETPEQVGARADRVIARVRAIEGNVVVFAHGHVLRVLVARWLGLPVSAGQHFLLDTATLSVLGDLPWDTRREDLERAPDRWRNPRSPTTPRAPSRRSEGGRAESRRAALLGERDRPVVGAGETLERDGERGDAAAIDDGFDLERRAVQQAGQAAAIEAEGHDAATRQASAEVQGLARRRVIDLERHPLIEGEAEGQHEGPLQLVARGPELDIEDPLPVLLADLLLPHGAALDPALLTAGDLPIVIGFLQGGGTARKGAGGGSRGGGGRSLRQAQIGRRGGGDDAAAEAAATGTEIDRPTDGCFEWPPVAPRTMTMAPIATTTAAPAPIVSLIPIPIILLGSASWER